MLHLHLHGHAQACVWHGSPPQDADCPQGQVMERRQRAGSPTSVIDRVVAVELLVPRGATFQYGLLGAQFQPEDGGEVVLRAVTSTVDGPVRSCSLANP